MCVAYQVLCCLLSVPIRNGWLCLIVFPYIRDLIFSTLMDCVPVCFICTLYRDCTAHTPPLCPSRIAGITMEEAISLLEELPMETGPRGSSDGWQEGTDGNADTMRFDDGPSAGGNMNGDEMFNALLGNAESMAGGDGDGVVEVDERMLAALDPSEVRVSKSNCLECNGMWYRRRLGCVGGVSGEGAVEPRTREPENPRTTRASDSCVWRHVEWTHLRTCFTACTYTPAVPALLCALGWECALDSLTQARLLLFT